jgi:hypothetical protein
MKERRGSVRKKDYGMVLLVPNDAKVDRVAGVLIDVNHRGFRVRHSYSGFRRNSVVAFIHRVREGTARVVWTRALGQEFETGFEYLDNNPGQ